MAGQKIAIQNLTDLENFLRPFVANLGAKTALLITGPLGIGKTKTVELILHELGFAGVSSPTFTLHQRYELSSGRAVDHFDLYRIESEGDLESVGIWDVLSQAEGLVVVEWADRLPKAFHAPGWQVIHLDFTWRDEKTRWLAVTTD